MPSSTSYTESHIESQTGSQSSRGPHITQWLPQLVLAALVSVGVASVVGLSLAAVAFSDPEKLQEPGHGIAQSFVMFASMSSLFYLPLHLLACRKADDLYFDPPIPSFQHQLHAWATLTIQITVAMWASATIPVAIAIYRGGKHLRHDNVSPGGDNAPHLKAAIFACATGLLFSTLLLTVIHFAHRPFTLPWLSPAVYDESASGAEGEYDKLKFEGDKSSDSSGSSIHRARPRPKMGGSTGKSSSRSTSSTTASSRARKMTRTRRYVLEAPSPPPVPVPVVPMLRASADVKRSGSLSAGSTTDRSLSAGSTTDGSLSGAVSTDSGGGWGRSTPPTSACASTGGEEGERDGASGSNKLRLEDELVPSPGGSESYFAAASSSSAGNSPEPGKAKAGVAVAVVEVRDRPVTPVKERRGGYAGRRAGNGGGARAAESPSVFRFRRKTAPKGGKGSGGDGGDGGLGKGAASEPPVTAPVPAPPPPTYWVPGAWLPQGQSEEGAVEDV